MLRNLILIAIRNFSRQILFSGINVIGLAVGIASFLLILVYVFHETSYDDFHPDADRLYRVNQTNIWSPAGGQMSSTVIPLAGALQDEFPEVESTLRIYDPGEMLVKYNDKAIYENNILSADPNFFDFFGFHLKDGNPETALLGKNKVVISSSVAEKFFGNKSPIGKTLLFGKDKVPVEVTGVVGKPPANAHFSFEYLLSLTTNPIIEEFEWSWFMTPLVTYLKLNKDASAAALEEKLKTIGPKYVPATLERFNMNYEDFIADKGGWNFYLQPVKDIHLYSAGVGNRIGTVSDINYIYIFSAVALFILILGCINFINLSTARASSRAKEVGIRKVLGSHQRQLIGQYLLESIILCFIATIIGIAIMEVLRVILQDLVGIQLVYNWKKIWPVILFLPLLLGALAGVYPAFYLTAFQPAKVLKGNLRSGIKSAGFRNILVVVQFTVSIILLVSTIVVHEQLNFLNTKNLGFDRENVVVINHADRLGSQLTAYRNILREHSTIESASISMDMPGRGNYEDMFTKLGDEEQVAISQMKIDPSFFETMKLQLIAGKLFKEDQVSDYSKVIINESAAKKFGWKTDEAIGQFLNYTGDEVGKLEIIGVVKDFHFQSLREPINPFVFLHYKSQMWGEKRVMAVKYNGSQAENVIPMLKNEWEKISNEPFSYSFLDAEFEGIYQAETKMGILFSIFTSLTLIIASIGLFGLSAYTVVQREKEISIRKIFGASINHLLMLFSKEYLLLIFISFVIAVPLSTFGIERWLQTYEFHISPTIYPYFITGLSVIFLVIIVSGYKVLAAALKNPAHYLTDN